MRLMLAAALVWIELVPNIFAQYRFMPLRWSSLAVALANLAWLMPVFLASPTPSR